MLCNGTGNQTKTRYCAAYGTLAVLPDINCPAPINTTIVQACNTGAICPGNVIEFSLQGILNQCSFPAPINCPWNYPFAMNNGTICCQNANKTNNVSLDQACNGGTVGITDPPACCSQNALITCPNNVTFGGVCTTNPYPGSK